MQYMGGAIPGDTALLSQVPSVVKAALVTVPGRPNTTQEFEAAGPSSDAGLAAADPRVFAAPSQETWFARLKQCKSLSEMGIALAWGLHSGFLPLGAAGARPTRPAGSTSRARGLFPLPVEVPVEILDKGDLSFLDLGSPMFSPLAIKCWRAVSCAALNALYVPVFLDWRPGRKNPRCCQPEHVLED